MTEDWLAAQERMAERVRAHRYAAALDNLMQPFVKNVAASHVTEFLPALAKAWRDRQ